MDDERFVRIFVGNAEKAIWRVSDSQWQVMLALKDLGAIGNDVILAELDIELMN